MRALVGRKRRDIGAEQFDLSGIRPHVAADLVEQRGLAGAVWTDDEAAFAFTDLEGHALGDRQSPKRLIQVDDLQRMIWRQRVHRDRFRSRAVSLLRPGTMPVGITRTMNRNTSPRSMFQRSI